MKPSVAPSKVVENPQEYNLTDNDLSAFFEIYREYNKLNINKTSNNITNSTSFDDAHQAVNCSEYCNSQMRHLFDDYRHYHGYVTLIVSI